MKLLSCLGVCLIAEALSLQTQSLLHARTTSLRHHQHTTTTTSSTISGLFHSSFPPRSTRRIGVPRYATVSSNQNRILRTKDSFQINSVATTSNDDGSSPYHQRRRQTSAILALVTTTFAPLWTVLAATLGITKSKILSPSLGSLAVMQPSLAFLMLCMGLTITAGEVRHAVRKPHVLLLNAVLCFGMMPLLASTIARVGGFDAGHTAGIILLGSVGGGQASNLFTLLAGGDVALSVVCTMTTTLLGVIATPLLIRCMLGCVVSVNAMSVVRSVASLVLIPLSLGLSLGRIAPHRVQKLRGIFPSLGLFATLILVTGGAANAASSGIFGTMAMAGMTTTKTVAMTTIGRTMDWTAITASCLLACLGGGIAWILSNILTPNMSEKCRRMLVMETLSKSPTLAYVLAEKHFGRTAAAIPAVAMVSLAVIGAALASLWTILSPLHEGE